MPKMIYPHSVAFVLDYVIILMKCSRCSAPPTESADRVHGCADMSLKDGPTVGDSSFEGWVRRVRYDAGTALLFSVIFFLLFLLFHLQLPLLPKMTTEVKPMTPTELKIKQFFDQLEPYGIEIGAGIFLICALIYFLNKKTTPKVVPVLDPIEWRPFKLIKKTQLTHNVAR